METEFLVITMGLIVSCVCVFILYLQFRLEKVGIAQQEIIQDINQYGCKNLKKAKKMWDLFYKFGSFDKMLWNVFVPVDVLK